MSVAGIPARSGQRFSLFIMYSVKKCSFSDACKYQ
nr:MAG TPA: hypothetical protein [Caudoviricetes sp.]